MSNAVSRLEERLGVRLLVRTTRRVNVTEDGTAFLDHCRRILAELEEAEMVLSRSRLAPTGRLRIDMPVLFGRLKIVPLLGAFRAQYPDLTLALSFADRYVDLIEEGIDVAVRMGTCRDQADRPATDTRQFRCTARPHIFRDTGHPRAPEDLAQHNCLAFTSRETRLIRDWRFRRRGVDLTVMPRGDMSFSDGAAICRSCAGYGLAQMHDFAPNSGCCRRSSRHCSVSSRPRTRFRWFIRPAAISRRRSGFSSIS